MAEYTPNTHAVRETYAANPFNGIPADGRAEFDRWYEAEKSKWQSEAFVEGGVFVLRDQGLPNDVYVRDALDKHNPYRDA